MNKIKQNETKARLSILLIVISLSAMFLFAVIFDERHLFWSQ